MLFLFALLCICQGQPPSEQGIIPPSFEMKFGPSNRYVPLPPNGIPRNGASAQYSSTNSVNGGGIVNTVLGDHSGRLAIANRDYTAAAEASYKGLTGTFSSSLSPSIAYAPGGAVSASMGNIDATIGTVASARVSMESRYGSASADLNGVIGAQAKGGLTASYDPNVGAVAAEAKADLFAGARASGSVQTEVAGLGAGASGRVGVGLGIEGKAKGYCSLQAKCGVEIKIGGYLGIGASAGFKIQADIPKVTQSLTDAAVATQNAAVSVGNWVVDQFNPKPTPNPIPTLSPDFYKKAILMPQSTPADMDKMKADLEAYLKSVDAKPTGASGPNPNAAASRGGRVRYNPETSPNSGPNSGPNSSPNSPPNSGPNPSERPPQSSKGGRVRYNERSGSDGQNSTPRGSSTPTSSNYPNFPPNFSERFDGIPSSSTGGRARYSGLPLSSSPSSNYPNFPPNFSERFDGKPSSTTGGRVRYGSSSSASDNLPSNGRSTPDSVPNPTPGSDPSPNTPSSRYPTDSTSNVSSNTPKRSPSSSKGGRSRYRNQNISSPSSSTSGNRVANSGRIRNNNNNNNPSSSTSGRVANSGRIRNNNNNNNNNNNSSRRRPPPSHRKPYGPPSPYSRSGPYVRKDGSLSGRTSRN